MQTLRNNLLASLLLISLFLVGPVHSAPLLTITPDTSIATTSAGGTVTFTGAIINRTNVDLNSTDFIFNFSDYDGSILAPNQLLGATDIDIPSFSFINGADLFSVMIAADARAGRYALTVLLQDVFGNFADSFDIGIIVEAAAGDVPEPGTVYLAGLCLAMLVLARRWTPVRPTSALH